jgi:hypothetical protein
MLTRYTAAERFASINASPAAISVRCKCGPNVFASNLLLVGGGGIQNRLPGDV